MNSERIEVSQPGGPEVLRLVPFRVPDPGPNEVIVAVERAGVSFGDVMLRRHVFRDVPSPAVPGYDVVGSIDRVGEAVTHVSVGDRVAAFVEYGGYTRHALVRAVDVVRMPDGVDPSLASAVILNYATAEQLIEAADVAPGDWLLVHGARGGVGSAVRDVARLAGLRVLGGVRRDGLAPSTDGVPLFDGDDPHLRERVLAHTGGVWLGAVIEPRAGRWLWQSRSLLRRGGTLVVSGLSSVAGRSIRDRLATLGTLASLGLMRLDPTMRLRVSAIDQVYRRTPARVHDTVERLLVELARGELRPKIGATFDLSRAAEAHRLMESGTIEGKIVLTT